MKNFRLKLVGQAFLLAALFFAAPVFAADITITAASVLASGSATKDSAHNAGVTLTAGQVVYLDPATTTYKLADANAASPIYKVAGIALNNAGVGQPVVVCTSDTGGFAIGGTVAAGSVVILSATPGAIAPIADAATGVYVTVLGIGSGSNKIIFKPQTAGVAVP